MRKKIILSLFALFVFLTVGTVTAVVYMSSNVSELQKIVKLHEVEELRRSLIIHIQNVQTELYNVNTPLASDLDFIVGEAAALEKTARQCSSCHHPANLSERIEHVQSLIEDYKKSLSYYMTSAADRERIVMLRAEAALIGKSLIALTGEMSHNASKNLEGLSDDAVKRMSYVRTILLITIIITFILCILAAVNLTKAITRPINELVNATRLIASGEFGSTISYKDTTEFGELAEHFNTMSLVIKEGYEKIQQEIVERKRTQESLAKSEKFLSTIFNSIRDPFCIVDRDYKIVRANEAYAYIRNKTADELINRKCYETLYNKTHVCDNCIVATTFKSADTCAKDKFVILENGEKVWLEIYTYPIFDEYGSVSYVIEYTRDITDRKNIETALKESKERYELAASGSNDGLWDWNLKTREIYFSRRWKSMLGFEDKEIENKQEEWFNRVHPDDRSQLETILYTHINGLTPHFECEYRILHKDGAYCWVLSRGLAVRDSAGKAYRVAGSQTDITERKVSEEQLQHKALHDLLTDLPNRFLLLDRMQLFFGRSKRHRDYAFAVLFLDIDRFKNINDSLGHIVGDKLLIAIARRLKTCVRPGDTVARLGGDEFAILCDDIHGVKDVKNLAERIHEEMSVPFTMMGHEIFATTSIGIAVSSDEYNQPEQLLRDADTAMYHAKSLGKACHVVFDKSMHDRAVALLQIETDLRRAIERGEFSIYYQPIIEIETGRISGFEALLRWNHPSRGFILPNEFIHIAEETGLIIPITKWVLTEACYQARIWNEQFQFVPSLMVSVNIPGVQFRPGLLRDIEKILLEAGLGAQNLILEVTESMLMDNAESAAALLLQLKEMNVRLQIDDFGTGYSSLSYLHHFPIDALKIDRSFIRMMIADKENFEIVKAIITLAHNLNMDVIAEGVENEEQLNQLKEMKCKFAQGFLFSRPLNINEIEMLLKKSLLPV